MTGLRHAIHLARRHAVHHAGRSLLIMLALALVAFLPIAVDGVVDAGGRALRARGGSTPLVAGAPGAPIDLVLSALYFRKPPDRSTTMGELDALAGSRSREIDEASRRMLSVREAIDTSIVGRVPWLPLLTARSILLVPGAAAPARRDGGVVADHARRRDQPASRPGCGAALAL